MNNYIKLVGTLQTEPTYSHIVNGEWIYLAKLAVKRKSGAIDEIEVLFPYRIENWDKMKMGSRLVIRGNIRTYNKRIGERNKLLVQVFARQIELDTDLEDFNRLVISGTICKNSQLRVTPKGREILDAIIASERNGGKSDYVPCIFWERNAKYVETLGVGKKIEIYGRLQSRAYNKAISETESEQRIAYEVSVGEFMEESDCNNG